MERTKIVMVTYYGLKPPLSSATRALVDMGYTVVSYPLFQYAHDVHDRREDVVEHMVEFIRSQQAGIVFWWCISIDTARFKSIVEQLDDNMCHLFYNWDDPYAWQACTGNDLAEKSRHFDCVLTCCKGSQQSYRNCRVKHVGWSLPGHDEHTFRPRPLLEIPDRFRCDVSICCTNVYENKSTYPNQLFQRKDLILAMCNASKEYNFSFKVFGPEHLLHHLPDASFYAGACTFEETALLFSGSKINLCTHVDASQYSYSNERVVTVLGSCGGVLLTDGVPGIEDILEPGVDAIVVYSVKEAVESVVKLLMDDAQRRSVSASGFQLARRLYTWHHWAKRVHRLLSKHFWSMEEYQTLLATLSNYNSVQQLPETNTQCWQDFCRRLEQQFTFWSFVPPRPSDFDGGESEWRDWLKQCSSAFPRRNVALSSQQPSGEQQRKALDAPNVDHLCLLKLSYALRDPEYLCNVGTGLGTSGAKDSATVHSLILQHWAR